MGRVAPFACGFAIAAALDEVLTAARRTVDDVALAEAARGTLRLAFAFSPGPGLLREPDPLLGPGFLTVRRDFWATANAWNSRPLLEGLMPSAKSGRPQWSARPAFLI